jgi:hypothetical protein
MEFLRGEGKNADPNVSAGIDWTYSYVGITLLEEAILHRSLEDVRMLVSNKNVRGIDLQEAKWNPQNDDPEDKSGKIKYGHTLMHSAIASPQEMEKCWERHFKNIQYGRETYPGLTTKYPNLKEHKPSDLHASAEIVQLLIDAFKEREKEWVVLEIHEKNPKYNNQKDTTPLDLVKNYLDPENVKNYKGKERESYEKYEEEYIRIRNLLQKTQNDIRESGGSRGYEIRMMSGNH